MSHDTPKPKPTTSYHDRPKQREAVLILAHGDGWIEAYAQRHVDVRIAMVPQMNGAEGRRLAEDYVELVLPPTFRELYWPVLRRAAQLLRVIRPTDVLKRQVDLDLLRTLDRIANHGRERRVWTL